MDEDSMKSSLDTYTIQLHQVETALQAAGEETNADLVKLRDDLQELVQLTSDSLLSLRKSQVLGQLDTENNVRMQTSTSLNQSPTENDIDAEFAAFQAAIADDCDVSEAIVGSPHNCAASSEPDLNEIVASKCCVMYGQEWGEKRAHNAVILQIEPITASESPQVRVMFCNPTHRSMLPCAYFMEGDCRYEDDECRFSHGHVVAVDDLQEYKQPDYSHLTMESKCLAKQVSGVWHRATVVGLAGDDENYQLMFDHSHDVHSVPLEDIIPLENHGDDDGSDDEESSSEEAEVSSISSDDDDDEEDIMPVYLWRPSTTELLGEWETYTRGIGSKLMAKMGYISGEGLGKQGQGRAEPVPIQLLPAGKSLDKIMELKERAGDQDLYDVLKKRKKKKSYHHVTNNRGKPAKHSTKDVFDFINKKLSKTKGQLNFTKNRHEKKPLPVSQISEAELKKRSDKHINVQLFKTDEEIKNVKRELDRLKMTLDRHDKTDKRMANQTRQKIDKMERYYHQLETSQRALQTQRKRRSDHKKLTVF